MHSMPCSADTTGPVTVAPVFCDPVNKHHRVVGAEQSAYERTAQAFVDRETRDRSHGRSRNQHIAANLDGPARARAPSLATSFIWSSSPAP